MMIIPCHPVILVLLGLPGSGKTTLARWLHAHMLTMTTEVHHIEYDAVFHDLMEAKSSSEFSPGAWKASRERAQQQVEKLAETISGRDSPGMIIVDDNMFYRSMRKRVFLIAKRSRCAYVQLFVDASLADALASNEQRPVHGRVQPSVIERMHSSLQRPDGTRFPWEASSIIVQGPLGPPDRLAVVGPSTLSSIATFWHQRLAPTPDAPRLDASLTMQPSDNLHHQLDLATRHVMQQVCSRAGRPHADRIKQLNSIRRDLLAACRLLPAEELEATWLHIAAGFSSLAERPPAPQPPLEQPHGRAAASCEHQGSDLGLPRG